VRRLQRMMVARGLLASAACTKAARLAACCPHCPSLFASFRKEGGRYLPMSRQQISGVVKKAINLVQSGRDSFSGIFMGRAEILQAVHARVLETILYLQSCHGSGLAARAYIVPEDPPVLYETERAAPGSVPVANGDAGFGRLIVDSRGGRAAVGVAFKGSSAMLDERNDTTEDLSDDSDEAAGTSCMLHTRRRQGHSLLTTGLGNAGSVGSLVEAPAHDLNEMMDRYTVDGRLLVNCENLANTMPACSSQTAAKWRSHVVDREAGAAEASNQVVPKRPATRAWSVKDE
jgi:hypothetical protein